MTLVTSHAIERFQERVRNVSKAEAVRALTCAAVKAAADFGAPYVRLATGQRIVLEGSNVVTVLPTGTPSWRLGTPKEFRHG